MRRLNKFGLPKHKCYINDMEIKVMSKFIKECIVGTMIITSIVLFLAAAVIAIYKAAGM